MKTWLPLLHASLAALWLGCVLTEGLFERALLAGGPGLHRLLAGLHRRVDYFVELPALFGVVLSGGLMLAAGREVDGLLAAKIAAGAVAVTLNLWCVVLVLRRRDRAEAGDVAGFARIDHAQHLWGAGVLLALLLAFALALLRRAGA